jgi:hypothetical protein
LCFIFSIRNVYKVVQARKGSMLLALAMVILQPIGCTPLTLFAYNRCNIVFLFLFSFTLLLCSWVESLFGTTQICFIHVFLFHMHYGLHSGIVSWCRHYLSPSDIIGNYPHLVVVGTGLAFGFLVVRYLWFNVTIHSVELFYFLSLNCMALLLLLLLLKRPAIYQT